ncbi:hypothetical protein PAL_GLEAN10021840 [Pteropus alecto]|uniref:Uncharacterized protein n=1 Tax=Pteropus alecto TaxID=9402 RepID=L5KPL9_PTEAL|nr:hypothetical protein PAL_GLEAN10021840 [Pteropus alecto]
MSGTPTGENPTPPSDLEGDAEARSCGRASRAISTPPSDASDSDAPGTSAWERHRSAPLLPLPRAGGPLRGVEFRGLPHLRPGEPAGSYPHSRSEREARFCTLQGHL